MANDWRLLLIEDGEVEEIGRQRFEDEVVFWREFIQRFLATEGVLALTDRRRDNSLVRGTQPCHFSLAIQSPLKNC